MTDIHTRRDLLITAANTNTVHDYLSELHTTIGEITLTIRYVPDRDLTRLDDLHDYFALVFSTPNALPETIAGILLDDFNNELIPRWIQITVSHTSNANTHRVILEDQQPNWNNPTLINRLKRI